jgi:hypothetical protein
MQSNVLGFQVLAVVVMTSFIHRNTAPCCMTETIRRFGGKYYLHPQSRKASQERNQHQEGKVEFWLPACIYRILEWIAPRP